MVQRAVATPLEYVEALDGWQLDKVQTLRRMVAEVVPDAVEGIKWGMISYEHAGDLCAIAAQKQYVSFYVMPTSVVAAHHELLAGIDVGKSCLRFKKTTPFPIDHLKVLLKAAAEAKKTCAES